MIVNAMEEHVRAAYHRLKGAVEGFVDTPSNRDDAIVYALNRLPPKYVLSPEGKAVTGASLDEPQHRTAIDVKVIEAITRVARLPRDAAGAYPRK
ncbi:MAG: late competence development ComFB family protein [Gemmatimonadales bacterium]|nr:late competence development ComFB family protein [Gemmatimonadales bacterium]